MGIAPVPAPTISPWPEVRRLADGGDGRLYVEPLALLHGSAAKQAVAGGIALPLLGGPIAFTAARVWLRQGETTAAAVTTVTDLQAWEQRAHADLTRLTTARAPLAGLDPQESSPRVMAVINVTPDSFSDGGDYADADTAIACGLQARAEGADILDVGGESTRPGAAPVDVEEEKRRVLPVVSALAEAGALVSIDTRRAAVMAAAIAAGARVVNDVSALTADRDSIAVVAKARVPVVLMHMRGEPGTMQDDPTYVDAALDIYDYLAARVAACVAGGIRRDHICIDPGIGFGKTTVHNLELIDRLPLFHGLGCPLLLGVSRKSFIARLADDASAKQRLPGSLAAGLAGAAAGVHVLRVHDVTETVQALQVWRALTVKG